MMNARSGLAIAASLIVGLSLAFAGPTTKSSRARIPSDDKGQIPHVSSPRPPGVPTKNQVLARARQKFLDRPYRGHQITANPKAKGNDLAIQEKIANMLNAKNFVPERRAAQFLWVANEPKLRHRGWYGTIQSVAQKDGFVAVSVLVTPMLDHLDTMRNVLSADYVIETYAYDGKELRYLDGFIPENASHTFMMH